MFHKAFLVYFFFFKYEGDPDLTHILANVNMEISVSVKL
mgnify:CR=1 FL=1